MNIAMIGQSKKAKAVSALCAAALALAMMPAAAFADATGSTDLLIQADDAQISVTAPTQIPLVIGTDGAFVTPEDISFENGSAMPVYIKSFTFEGFGTAGTAVADAAAFASSSASNVWYAAAYPGEAAGSLAYLTAGSEQLDAKWGMGASDSGSAELPLTVSGAMKNITKNYSAGETAGRVTWTFGVAANPAAE